MKTPSMTTYLRYCLASLLAWSAAAFAAENEERCFELRTYYAAPGKLADLNARFREHTVKLFEKHGITNLGYWVPRENPEQKLIYLLAFPSREARDASFKAFGADPAWQAAVRASEAQGRLVVKIESILLRATDFTPEIKPTRAERARCFELRLYQASPGNLEALQKRFREHTLALFTKHGMTNLGYWIPQDKNQGADDTLIYLLAHPSQEAAAEAFKAFRADPDWGTAKQASEVNGPLTRKVESVFLVPTDYSAWY